MTGKMLHNRKAVCACSIGCCNDHNITNRTLRTREKRTWRKEAW